MTLTAMKTCDECPMSKRDEWRARGAIIRMELGRHDLTFREMILANIIVDKTYGWQRTDVVIPRLRYFRELTNIGEPDVVKVLKSLHRRRIIRVVTVKGQPTYSINPDTDAWKANPKTDKSTMQSANNLLREINGLEPIHIEQEAELNFKNCPPAKKMCARDLEREDGMSANFIVEYAGAPVKFMEGSW